MQSTPRKYRFDEFLLDPRTLELLRREHSVHLEPLPARILVRLVELAGEMVSRKELRELGWPRLPGAADQSLNTCIRQIRDALGDDAAAPRFVETLRGRGYRFAMPVETEAVALVGSGPSPTTPRFGARGVVAAAAALLAIAAAALAGLPRSTRVEPTRILVESPIVLGAAGAPSVLADALADELRAALAAAAPGLVEVFGRPTTLRLLAADTAATLLTPAAAGATHTLALSIRPRGAGVRIVARLVDVADQTVVWGGSADADEGSLARVAADLTVSVTRALGAGTRSAPPVMELPLETRRPLVKARHLLEGHRDLDVALAVLDSLLDRQPDVAAAHGLRAEILLRLGDDRRAAEAADRALHREPGNTDALRAKAGVLMLKGRWVEAESALQAALEHGPGEAATLNARAFLYSLHGRFRDAEGALRHAARIDPLSPVLVGDAGLMHLWAGRYAEAERACAETLQLAPEATWALGCLFDARVRGGGDAAEPGRRILTLLAGQDHPGGDASPEAVIAAVRHGRVRSWEQAVAAGAEAFFLAAAYADAGRTEDALIALEHAVAKPTLALLTVAVDPRFGSLEDESRYQDVLRRLKLRTPG